MRKQDTANVRLYCEQGQFVWVCELPHKVRYAWEGGKAQAEAWANEWNAKLAARYRPAVFSVTKNKGVNNEN